MVSLLVLAEELGVALVKVVGRCHANLELQFCENHPFHLKDILLNVGFVCHIRVVLQLGWINFAIF